MINLFDNYNNDSVDLHNSLKSAGIINKTVAINYNGFLPDDVESPYSYYLGVDGLTENTLYFNRLNIPEYWEIKANNNFAEIYEYDQLRGKINYVEPTHNRLIHYVEWYDRKGNIFSTDHYDKFGNKYANSVYGTNGEILNTSYFDNNGIEILVENYVTKDIILNKKNNTIEIFKSKLDFVEYYLKEVGYYDKNIIFNTLSDSFFISNRNPNKGEDILVWQEDIYGELPGNMNFILNNDLRAKTIVVPNKQVYNKIMEIAPEDKKPMFKCSGYIYNFKRSISFNNQVFILTNTDNIENIEYIINNSNDCWFHIAAITEMSSKLMNLLNTTKNVTLHPNASYKKIEDLFKKCDTYLDINYENELMNAVRVAFENNMLILAFDSTIHNRKYVSDENIYHTSNVDELIKKLNNSIKNKDYKKELIKNQKNTANNVTKREYKNIFKH
ncbi:accessory Sec system glycosylation chaperone GtfB [Gemelliphila palaticanis]|uniref:UDP-N-acetylglucosamine--peptide N-acetylglucosaminyltransferase stabilizing protein GtfB n=1 Tax=Gemelliphila palaticanis TaxID=81950 RepID=A0ABX2T050_9BACL|nr:accessory Sec system glycosylation chaperone GtfB [Gemella palaticanis]MBF0716093.1 accessory Sec system glycosylation chaperone GtfB [Gemella palaticanis]NYS48023.1 accessory Sec system glycosylation chaperone GtfB [Gemella palaticanis]